MGFKNNLLISLHFVAGSIIPVFAEKSQGAIRLIGMLGHTHATRAHSLYWVGQCHTYVSAKCLGLFQSILSPGYPHTRAHVLSRMRHTAKCK